MIDLKAEPGTWQAGREFGVRIHRIIHPDDVRRYCISGHHKSASNAPKGIICRRCHRHWLGTNYFTYEGMGLVLEWLKPRYPRLEYVLGEKWQCHFYIEASGCMRILRKMGEADTAPLAVARALLSYASQTNQS